MINTVNYSVFIFLLAQLILYTNWAFTFKKEKNNTHITIVSHLIIIILIISTIYQLINIFSSSHLQHHFMIIGDNIIKTCFAVTLSIRFSFMFLKREGKITSYNQTNALINIITALFIIGFLFTCLPNLI